jgi:tetratricopeptide (TPR) repeat protein
LPVQRTYIFLFMLVGALMLTMVGCSHVYKPDSSTLSHMTPSQARKALPDTLRYLPTSNKYLFLSGKDYKNVINNIKVNNIKYLVFVGNDGNNVKFLLKDIMLDTVFMSKYAQVTINNKYNLLCSDTDTIGFWTTVMNITNKSAKIFTDSVYILKKNAIDEDNYESGFEKFVNASPKNPIKTTLSEEARRYKIQAESAIRDKNYDEAADLYREALNIAPWWAEGHFNRALMMSEIGEFDTAILEMKRYLQLDPGATDARAAQDKIYDWERTQRRQN